MPGVDGRIAQREEVATELGEGRLAEHGPREVEDGGRRHVAVLRGNQSPAADEPPLPGLLVDRVEEPRLSDPGLAGDEEELTSTGD